MKVPRCVPSPRDSPDESLTESGPWSLPGTGGSAYRGGMKKTMIVSAAVVALFVSACSVSVGTSSLSATEVEEKATAALAESQGIPLEEMPPLDCPSDLTAEVGASIVCVIGDPAQGNTYDVTITVETVEGEDVGFDIQVADAPRQ